MEESELTEEEVSNLLSLSLLEEDFLLLFSRLFFYLTENISWQGKLSIPV
jgi:hypothetical protein